MKKLLILIALVSIIGCAQEPSENIESQKDSLIQEMFPNGEIYADLSQEYKTMYVVINNNNEVFVVRMWQNDLEPRSIEKTNLIVHPKFKEKDTLWLSIKESKKKIDGIGN